MVLVEFDQSDARKKFFREYNSFRPCHPHQRQRKDALPRRRITDRSTRNPGVVNIPPFDEPFHPFERRKYFTNPEGVRN